MIWKMTYLMFNSLQLETFDAMKKRHEHSNQQPTCRVFVCNLLIF